MSQRMNDVIFERLRKLSQRIEALENKEKDAIAKQKAEEEAIRVKNEEKKKERIDKALERYFKNKKDLTEELPCSQCQEKVLLLYWEKATKAMCKDCAIAYTIENPKHQNFERFFRTDSDFE